jgi:hypothetical protein
LFPPHWRRSIAAAAAPEKVGREAGYEIEGGRKIGGPFALRQFPAAIRILDLLQLELNLLGNSHGRLRNKKGGEAFSPP